MDKQIIKSSHSNNPNQDIIYHISHDLGAPIRHIRNFSRFLSEKYQSQLDENAQEWLYYIQHSSEKAQSMLDSLLQYSRILSCDKTKEPINLDECWQTALGMHGRIITEKKAEIQHSTLPQISAIKEHWVNLFSALLSNSLLYQPAGQTPKIQLNCEECNGALIFSFQDNGIGVAKEYYGELTTFFKRLNSEDEFPGIGMGLTLCECILQFYGGEIQFRASSLGGLEAIFSITTT